MEILYSLPSQSQFTPLTEHQSTTPTNFYSSRPVLHHHSRSATLLLTRSDLALCPAFSSLLPPTEQTNGDSHPTAQSRREGNGAAAGEEEDEEGEEEVKIENIDIWITSS